MLPPPKVPQQLKNTPSYIFKKNKNNSSQGERQKSRESLNSSKAKVNAYEGSYENEYRKLGQTDKYCE